jgi:hypothetical protein
MRIGISALADTPVITTVDPTMSTGPSFPLTTPAAAQYQTPVFSSSNPGCPWYCFGALLGSPTDQFGSCEACFCQSGYTYDEDLSTCMLASVEAAMNATGAIAAAPANATPPGGVDCTLWYNSLFSSTCPADCTAWYSTFSSGCGGSLTPWLIGAGVLLAAIVVLPMLGGQGERK